MTRFRLVTFDALHTLITPRQPIHVQYSQVFSPYVGVLPPDGLKSSFKTALKAVRIEHPSYSKGTEKWWEDVIRRTALGAGASKNALDASLLVIVKELMKRFSSREGYKAFNDAIPTIRYLHEKLGVRTAVISNGDSRLRSVLRDLEFPEYLQPIVLSEECGVEKPAEAIFMKTLSMVNERVQPAEGIIRPNEVIHVGDDLDRDYYGALKAGFHGVLLRRIEGEGEVFGRVKAISSLWNLGSMCQEGEASDN